LVEPPYNLTQEAIAKRVGKNQCVIARFLALLELPPEVQLLLSRGTLTESHARWLRKLPDSGAQIELASRIDREGISVRETEKRVKAMALYPKSTPPSEDQEGSPNREDSMAEIWPLLREKVEFPGSGRWAVRFKNGDWILRLRTDPRRAPQVLGEFFERLGQAIRQIS
jgi:ParB-like chromosome segregation protein Spo0J